MDVEFVGSLTLQSFRWTQTDANLSGDDGVTIIISGAMEITYVDQDGVEVQQVILTQHRLSITGQMSLNNSHNL